VNMEDLAARELATAGLPVERSVSVLVFAVSG